MALSGSAGRRYAEALIDLAGDPAAVESFRVSLDRLAGAIPAGADGLVFLPALSGAMAPASRTKAGASS